MRLSTAKRTLRQVATPLFVFLLALAFTKPWPTASTKPVREPPLGKGQGLKMFFPGVIFDAEITAKLFCMQRCLHLFS